MTTIEAKPLTEKDSDHVCLTLINLLQKLPEGDINRLPIIKSLADLLADQLSRWD